MYVCKYMFMYVQRDEVGFRRQQ